MAFVYEKIPAEDLVWLRDLHLMHFTRTREVLFFDQSKWCADRERNAFLISVGRLPDTLKYHVLLWRGKKILVGAEECGTGNKKTGVHEVWELREINVPVSLWESKEEIISLLKDGFSLDSPFDPQYIQSMMVNLRCEPTMVEEDFYV